MSALVREKIRALERKKAQLQRREAQLVNERRNLLLRNGLLTAWCEALTLLQVSAFIEESSSDCGAVQEQFQVLLNEEIALLQELTVSKRLDSCTLDDTAELLDPGPDCISPGDPMAYFREMVAKGPIPEAAHWTPLEVATMLREAVLHTSLYFNVQQAQQQGQEHFMPCAAEVWDRYLHVLLSVIMLGREHVGEGVSCFNLDTLEARPEYAVASEQRTATLAPRLSLTERQKDIISAGVDTSQALIAMIHKQREEVMAKLDTAAAAVDAGPSNTTQPSACSNGMSMSAQGSWTPAEAAADMPEGCQALASSSRMDSSSSSDTLGSLSALNERQQHLETQQQLAARLKLLMAKEYTLIMALSGLLVGCLTYQQLTIASVLGWPYSIRMPYWARDIHAMRQEELSGQQQRGTGSFGQEQ